MKTVAPASCSRRTIAKPIPARRLTPVTRALRPVIAAVLRGENADDLAHGLGRCAQRLLLLVAEVELDDLFDPAGAELHGDAHIEAVDAVLALEIRGAREHAALVQHDRVDHLGSRCAGRVPRGGAHE